MNTPTHLLLNLAVLTHTGGRRVGGWVAAGALLPDLPMFVFYVWQRWVLGAGEGLVWGERYFDPSWQRVFDLFNSAPLFAVVGLVAVARRRVGWAFLCASAQLHFLGDVFLHREDGHRHLWPLADWRFMSPVSYWDPAYHGGLVAALEVALVIGSAAWLGRGAGRPARLALASLCALYVAGWLVFYGVGPGRWGGAS